MSGYVMTYVEGAVSWQSQLQKSVALSNTEVEYMVAVEAEEELIWMRNFLDELGMKQKEFLLHCDSQSAIHLAKNVAYHSRTKHIQRRYHWLKDKVDDGKFSLVKIHTDDNGFDVLTKNLPMNRGSESVDKVDSALHDSRGSLLGICLSCGRSRLFG